MLTTGVQWLVGRVGLLRFRRPEARLALAGGLITDNEGRVLLIHRRVPGMSWWEVPGGKIEAGEEPWEAARRELLEELNVAVEHVADLGSAEFRHENQVLQYTWYVVRIQQGDPEVVEHDRFDQLRFFTWDELVSLREHASPSVRYLVKRKGPQVGDGLAGLMSSTPSALESAPAR